MLWQHSQASTLCLPIPPSFPWLRSNGDRRLNIHRPAAAHHGRALGVLGHAAEHLTVRVAFCTDGRLAAADLEPSPSCRGFAVRSLTSMPISAGIIIL